MALALAALGGCGGVKPGDLFVVSRTGSTPQSRLTLLVNEEGGVHCNGAPAAGKLSDPELVQARAIQEELHSAAASQLQLAPQRGSVSSYTVREEAGTVRFADNSAGQPHVLRQLELFVLQVARELCGRAQ